MRIVGGTLRGRVFAAPEGLNTRPTSDRVREALFNILAHHDFGFPPPIKNAVVLDAFCGSGALAYEALSRGATEAFLMDQDATALDLAQKNAEKLGISSQCHFMRVDATKPPSAQTHCTLVFLDPPYRKDFIPLALGALEKAGWFSKQTLFVCETAKGERIQWPDGFKSMLERNYGATTVHFITRV